MERRARWRRHRHLPPRQRDCYRNHKHGSNQVFGPVSGAHSNRAVSLVEAVRGQLPVLPGYLIVQSGGVVVGVWRARLIFGPRHCKTSAHMRIRAEKSVSQIVMTVGLIPTRSDSHGMRWNGMKPQQVYIRGQVIRASTPFANGAVTIAGTDRGALRYAPD